MINDNGLTANGVQSFNFDNVELVALTDYFSKDEKASKSFLNSAGIYPGKLDDREFLKEGYAHLIADRIIDVNFDNTLSTHKVEGDDSMVSLASIIIGEILSKLASFVVVKIMLNGNAINMTVIQSDNGNWSAFWKGKNNRTSVLTGFSKNSMSPSVVGRIIPIISKTVDNPNTIINVIIKRFDVNNSLMVSTAMHGSNGSYYEPIPDNDLLKYSGVLDENGNKKEDNISNGSEYCYNRYALQDRIADVLEII